MAKTLCPEPRNELSKKKTYDTTSCAFPQPPFDSFRPNITDELEFRIPAGQIPRDPASISSVVQLAWAIVIASYTEVNHVVFDFSSWRSSYHPLWVQFRPEQSVRVALASLAQHTSNEKQLCRTDDILSPEGRAEITEYQDQAAQNALSVQQKGDSADSHSEVRYSLMVICEVHDTGEIEVHARFDARAISQHLVQMAMEQLAHVACCVGTGEPISIENLLNICPRGLQRVQAWNARLQLHPRMECIHEVISRKCQSQPSAPAVCAWDGDLSYFELDQLSDQLAAPILAAGLKQKSFVGLFLRKCMWTPVAMMAVMKAGAAFVLLDPALPDQRLATLCRISEATSVITTHDLLDRAEQLGLPVTLAQKQPGLSPREPPRRAAHPSHAAYAAFTSGSSGEPKGIVVDHVAVSSGVDAYCCSIGLHPNSRVLQFASYSFTISVIDHLITLMQGACLCVPSNDQLKNSLPETIRDFGANWVTCTPSVARVLSHDNIPSLKTLCLAGESLTRNDLDKWCGRLDLKSIYGQSENTLAALVDTKTASSHPLDLGYPFAANCWVVHPHNPNRLLPLGAEGELILEAPTMSRGYLHNEAQNKATFLREPAWLQDIRPGGSRTACFLRTGDIVRYRPENGALQYVARSGTQVKLRGQRIELAEVEFQLKLQLPAAAFAVAEIVFPTGEERSHEAVLAAFVTVEDGRRYGDDAPVFAPATEVFRQQVQKALPHLRQTLPEYMIPMAFIPLTRLPLTPSGKLNRRALRSEAAELGPGLQRYHVSQKAFRPPETEAERVLQHVCALILNQSSLDINMNDSFFDLGGNSISTMQLVSRTRDLGFSINSAHVFRQLSLAELAQIHREYPKPAKEGPVASKDLDSEFSLKADLIQQNPTHMDPETIADVFPCTETQIWMLNNHEGGHFLIAISGTLDIDRLRAACQCLIDKHTALRSVFVSFGENILQVVLRKLDLPLSVHGSGETFCDPVALAQQWCPPVDRKDPFPLGTLPLQFTLFPGRGEQHALVMRLSHAQYDGICLPNLISDLCASYSDSRGSITPTDFADFARQLSRQKTPEAFSFWRNLLAGSRITQLPHSVPQAGSKETLLKRSSQIPLSEPPAGITLATAVKAAWAEVLRQATGATDLVFGQLTNSRSIDLLGIHRMIGPCYNTVPVRVHYNPTTTRTYHDLMQSIQEQHVQSIPFQAPGWGRIASQSTNWPPDARPQTLVVHQNFNQEVDVSMGDSRFQLAGYAAVEPADMSLDLYSEPWGKQLVLTLLASSHFIAENDMQSLLTRLCDTLTGILTTPHCPLTRL